MSNSSRAKWPLLLLCFGLGSLQVLAFAPFEYWPLSFISLGIYFFLTYSLKPKAAFLAGLAYGYGLYGVGVSWVYVSLTIYGGMPFWMGSVAVLGFAGLLALFVAGASSLASIAFPLRFRLIGLPFVWVIFEWMKSWVLTGFPWLDIGYTQTSSWLFSWAPIGGVYLVSLMVAIVSSSLALLVAALSKSARVYLSSRAGLISVAALCMVVFFSFINDHLRWSSPVGNPIAVGIVQANVPVNGKWQSGARDKFISNYRTLSQQLKNNYQRETGNEIELLVWPETALPLYIQQTDTDFWKNITPSGTLLLTGILDSPSIAQGDVTESYNAAALSCDGDVQVYRKRHLVPFGEYLPLRFLFNWVLEYLELPMSDFSSWSEMQGLNCGEIKIGLSICYEDAFAAEYRQSVGDATLLVNISEDAWFGDSFAPHQRRQMAQMRARELSRPMVRSANSGPSLFIDERGRLLQTTSQFVSAILAREVQPHTGDTPFKRYGNWVIALCVLMIFVLAVLYRLMLWPRLKK